MIFLKETAHRPKAKTKTIFQNCKSKRLNFLKTTESSICWSVPAPLFSRMSLSSVCAAARVTHGRLLSSTLTNLFLLWKP